MVDFDSLNKGTVPTVIPFPAGLSRPDQTRDWANSLASAVAFAGLTHTPKSRRLTRSRSQMGWGVVKLEAGETRSGGSTGCTQYNVMLRS